jgi:hypothetical protein
VLLLSLGKALPYIDLGCLRPGVHLHNMAHVGFRKMLFGAFDTNKHTS